MISDTTTLQDEYNRVKVEYVEAEGYHGLGQVFLGILVQSIYGLTLKKWLQKDFDDFLCYLISRTTY